MGMQGESEQPDFCGLLGCIFCTITFFCTQVRYRMRVSQVSCRPEGGDGGWGQGGFEFAFGGMNGMRRALSVGLERPDFEQALREVSPSLTAEMLERLHAWAGSRSLLLRVSICITVREQI